MQDDKIIIQHYWDRDERALTETDEKYGRYCHTIAENILNNEEDSKECVNDTYLNTWNSIPPHRPKMFPAFIGKIARNLAINLYNQNRTARRGGGHINAVFDELEECIPDRSAEVTFSENELAEAINSFLASLPEKNRKILMLRYWGSESVSRIAQIMKMSENRVSAVLSRLRKKMKKHLDGRGVKL